MAMMTTETLSPPSGPTDLPLAPTTPEEAGLSLDLLIQLALKTLHFVGELTGDELARRLGLNFSVIEPALDFLKTQRQVEIAGGTMMGRASYRFRITDAGRARAALFLEANHYVGVAPVPFDQYRRYMLNFQKAAPRTATRDRVRDAFSHLVISQRVLDQLGPAINAGHSMFVYGPPGNGKTVISQAIRKLLARRDCDSARDRSRGVHHPVLRSGQSRADRPESPTNEDQGLDMGLRHDRRWVRCRRPMVMVGGELTLDALELSYNPATGFYRAPVQAIANGGVLVIDDFGRQQVRPARPVEPLDRAAREPRRLPDAAVGPEVRAAVHGARHLRDQHQAGRPGRRGVPAPHSLQGIRREPDGRGVHADLRELLPGAGRARSTARSSSTCSRTTTSRARFALRGCQPRDLIDQVLSLAEYRGEPRQLTPELLEAACASYFVDEQESPVVYA